MRWNIQYVGSRNETIHEGIVLAYLGGRKTQVAAEICYLGIDWNQSDPLLAACLPAH